MIDGVLNWVFGIAVYLILITLILQLLPERFRKYLNFYTGVLLMLIAIKPISALLKADTSLSNYFEMGEMALKLEEMSNSLSLTRDVTEDKLIEEYNRVIEERVFSVITGYGYTMLGINVDWVLDEESDYYGSIRAIEVILREKSTSGSVISGIIPIEPVVIGGRQNTKAGLVEKPEILAIKEKLADFYNLSEAHINIIIQE